MFARTEQNETKKAVIAKLLAVKQILTERTPADNLQHRFLLDVLNEILDEASNAVSLILPGDDYHTAGYEHELYVQYDVIYLEARETLAPNTLEDIIGNRLGLPNEKGIVSHQDELYVFDMDTRKKVSNILSIKDSAEPMVYEAFKKSIPHIRYTRHYMADAAQRALIARVIHVNNEKHARTDQLQVVIKLLEAIERGIENERDSCRFGKNGFLELALTSSVIGGGGLFAQGMGTLLISYAMGKAVTMAKMMILAYIIGGVVALILAVALGMALYCFIHERKYEVQLTKLVAVVNQSKTYDCETDITSEISKRIDRSGRTWLGFGNEVSTTLSINESNPKVAHIKMNYPSVATFFSHHAQEFCDLAPAFRNTL